MVSACNDPVYPGVTAGYKPFSGRHHAQTRRARMPEDNLATMAPDPGLFRVPLDGFWMQLRRSELEAVAAGLGAFDASEAGDLITLAEALRRLPISDRAPTWELAMRRYGHHKPLAQAAGEIGLDELHARELLDRFCQQLTEVPPPEDQGLDPSAALEGSGVARVMSAEMLGNAVAHGEQVDLDAAHEASLDAAAEIERKD